MRSRPISPAPLLGLVLFLLPLLHPAYAAAPAGCLPCVGIRLADAGVAPELLAAPPSPGDGRLLVAWEVPLDGTGSAEPAAAIAARNGIPWLSLVFRTPPPLARNAAALQRELAAAAAIAAQVPAGTRVQILWRPDGDGGAAGAAAVPAPPSLATSATAELLAAPAASATIAIGEPNPAGTGTAGAPLDPDAEYAFLLKRAGVAVSGAQADAVVVTAPLVPTAAALERLYAGDVAAYVDAVAIAPGAAADVAAVAAKLAELDPGRPLVVDATAFPADPLETAALAAENAAAGAGTTLFALADPRAAFLVPLKIVAHDFLGDLSYDPTPVTGAADAWTFVRGEDLALRVIARLRPGADATLGFTDPGLRRPSRIDLATAKGIAVNGRVTASGVDLVVPQAPSVVLLRVERASAAELEGVEEKVQVATERDIPVEEILRRLQAFEDAQNRRFTRYDAVNTTHLRFLVGGAQSIEATFEGPFFFRQGEGFDWVWQTFYINGVEWRSKKIPQLPIVQPQKAAAMPLEITFDRTYRYRLRGRDTVDGRDAWVVDFEPAPDAKSERLYRGTVWIDRQLSARLRTRALQLGLSGEVISNEETVEYRPVDRNGAAAPFAATSYWLPLRVLGEQILNVVNTATTVEKETLLTAVRIDPADFDERRQAAFASDSTMVRDTDEGLRYLVKSDASPDGRVVQEGFDPDQLFLVGGLFYDQSLDYPLPLAGLNYFSLDLAGRKIQTNVFFGGVLLIANAAKPRLFGGAWDAGVDLFGFAVGLGDSVWRGDEEIVAEEVKQRPERVAFNLGRTLGSYGRVEARYRLDYTAYSRGEDTAPEFRVPRNGLTHSFQLGATFSRGGYQLRLGGSWNRRDTWEAWGLPGSPERDAFDPATRDYRTWSAEASKAWHFRNFQKLGLEADYYGGQDLDRFSKYSFGYFGGTRVHGYRSNRVKAEEAWLGHATYGLEIGKLFRLEGAVDAALATDEATGLDRELLAGVGLTGQVAGPWETLINVDLGVPVAGPDDGFVVYLAFLKLFQ